MHACIHTYIHTYIPYYGVFWMGKLKVGKTGFDASGLFFSFLSVDRHCTEVYLSILGSASLLMMYILVYVLWHCGAQQRWHFVLLWWLIMNVGGWVTRNSKAPGVLHLSLDTVCLVAIRPKVEV
ncbi:uncharacterized protein P884DRAFT_114717 [Thermothelomyces heterothallicus CBS 202.75]|uniref:uncharacterized protein n=1 Tax=Thermothelomyces heterothallicus CBS 202.75 TaxID=1149848 RepID=UPI003741F682